MIGLQVWMKPGFLYVSFLIALPDVNEMWFLMTSIILNFFQMFGRSFRIFGSAGNIHEKTNQDMGKSEMGISVILIASMTSYTCLKSNRR